MSLRLELPKFIMEKVKRYESIKRLALRLHRKGGSVATVETYVKSVLDFCEWARYNPDRMLRAGIDWEGMINDYLDYLIASKKVARSSAVTYVRAIKKWLAVNGVNDVNWNEIDLPRTWRVEKDRVPTREELRDILNSADLPEKVMALIAISSGLRLNTIVELKLRDIKLDREIPIITIKPEMAKDRPTRGYITFLTPEAKQHLLAYLREREMRGEKITQDSYVIVKERPLGAPLTLRAARKRWERLLEKAAKAQRGRKWYLFRFHVLRKYFQTWCRLSGVDPWVTEAFMGHRAGIHQVYFASGIEDLENPGILKKVEEEYKKAIPALTVLSEEEKVRELEKRLEEQGKKLEEERKRFEEEKKKLELKVLELARNLERMEKELERLAKK